MSTPAFKQKTIQDFASGSCVTIKWNYREARIASSLLPEIAVIDLPLDDSGVSFSRAFRKHKVFCHETTYNNLKKRILDARRGRLGRPAISKEAALYAFSAVKSIMEGRTYSSKEAYLTRFNQLEEILENNFGINKTNSVDREKILSVFTRTCAGLVYPEEIQKFKDIYWDRIVESITPHQNITSETEMPITAMSEGAFQI